MKFLLMILLFSSLVLMPTQSNAQMSKAEVQEMLEFTAASSGFQTLCFLMIGAPGNHFRTNYNMLRDQLEMMKMEQDPELSSREAQFEVRAIIRTVGQDVRALVDNFGCEIPERKMFVDHYKYLANMTPDKLSSLLLAPKPQETAPGTQMNSDTFR
jgi:hypothetical protein